MKVYNVNGVCVEYCVRVLTMESGCCDAKQMHSFIAEINGRADILHECSADKMTQKRTNQRSLLRKYYAIQNDVLNEKENRSESIDTILML